MLEHNYWYVLLLCDYSIIKFAFYQKRTCLFHFNNSYGDRKWTIIFYPCAISYLTHLIYTAEYMLLLTEKLNTCHQLHTRHTNSWLWWVSMPFLKPHWIQSYVLIKYKWVSSLWPDFQQIFYCSNVSMTK